MSFPWNADHDAVIRRVAAVGGSFTDAALELGVSRNMVAGRAWREAIRFTPSDAKTRRAGRAAWEARCGRDGGVPQLRAPWPVGVSV